MVKEKKIYLNQTVKNIIIIVIIAVVFFLVGKLWPSGEEPTQMTSDLLSQQIQDISELATVEYNYTNMGKFENQATFMVGKFLLQQKVLLFLMMVRLKLELI